MTLPADPPHDEPSYDAPRDALEIEAAEYVLGLLPPGEAHLLAARTQTEPDLAARVEAWERRLLPLATLVEPIAPPDILWRRLALATGADQAPRRTPTRNRFWPGVAAGALAMAASVALFLLARPPAAPGPAAPGPVASASAAPGIEVAVLTAIAAPVPILLVRHTATSQDLVVVAGTPVAPKGRSLEVWALRPGATVPESVGLLPTQGPARLPLTLPTGTQLLVSQEPIGGSPTKKPTGPVVLHGGIYGL